MGENSDFSTSIIFRLMLNHDLSYYCVPGRHEALILCRMNLKRVGVRLYHLSHSLSLRIENPIVTRIITSIRCSASKDSHLSLIQAAENRITSWFERLNGLNQLPSCVSSWYWLIDFVQFLDSVCRLINVYHSSNNIQGVPKCAA